MDKIIEDIYDKLPDWKNGDIQINSRTVVVLIPRVIKLVQNVKGADSYKKKEIAMSVIRKIANEDRKLSETDKKLLIDIIETTVPIMIDTMIDIYRHRIDIGKAIKFNRDNCICF